MSMSLCLQHRWKPLPVVVGVARRAAACNHYSGILRSWIRRSFHIHGIPTTTIQSKRRITTTTTTFTNRTGSVPTLLSSHGGTTCMTHGGIPIRQRAFSSDFSSSSSGGGGSGSGGSGSGGNSHRNSGGKDGTTTTTTTTTAEDPFGILFDDGPGGLGPILPPLYERDIITGRVVPPSSSSSSSSSSGRSSSTHHLSQSNTTTTAPPPPPPLQQQREVSKKDRQLLSMNSLEHDVHLLDSVQEHWTTTTMGVLPEEQGTTNDGQQDDATDQHHHQSNDDDTGPRRELDAIGARIRSTHMATNVLGRSVGAQSTKEMLDDGSTLISSDETGFSQPLTLEEYQTFHTYMKTKHQVDVSVDDIPVTTQQERPPSSSSSDAAAWNAQQRRGNSQGTTTANAANANVAAADQVDLSLKWLSSRAQRQLDETSDDNPYTDLMPGDLTPNRLVNRKRAKKIPVKQLHANHLSLLQHYIGPTGQIMNRSQTRLGCRDQRHVTRLIKRARALGLAPFMGQFKVENHGWIHAPDMTVQRKWEQELQGRGLTPTVRKVPVVSTTTVSADPWKE
jgi:ribosomal protein S18